MQVWRKFNVALFRTIHCFLTYYTPSGKLSQCWNSPRWTDNAAVTAAFTAWHPHTWRNRVRRLTNGEPLYIRKAGAETWRRCSQRGRIGEVPPPAVCGIWLDKVLECCLQNCLLKCVPSGNIRIWNDPVYDISFLYYLMWCVKIKLNFRVCFYFMGWWSAKSSLFRGR